MAAFRSGDPPRYIPRDILLSPRPVAHSEMSDIKEKLESDRKNSTTIQGTLSHLRGLSEQEKTNEAFLQSRIDEQSQLIMVLKKTSDEKGVRLKTLERINEDLTSFRDEALGNMAVEKHKSCMLERRFNELAENHEEMIKIKDEYKRQLFSVTEENCRLREENLKRFSGIIQDRDVSIAELQKELASQKEKSITLDKQNGDLVTLVQQTEDKYSKEVDLLTSQLKDLREQFEDVSSAVVQLKEIQSNSDLTKSSKIAHLTKERDELLSLAMQRGKLIQEKVGESKKLQQKVDEMETNVREMQLKFERQSDEVNADVKVQRLLAQLAEANDKLEELKREYKAFKQHSAQLLEKEKELNMRLRKLAF